MSSDEIFDAVVEQLNNIQRFHKLTAECLLLLEEFNNLCEEESQYLGSVPGHKVVNRDRVSGHRRLMADYFSQSPTYDERTFRRRFRMRRSLFLRILEAIQEKDHRFKQKYDSAGVAGFSPYQKMTAALRQLAYGYSADCIDEYLRMSESSAMMWLKLFCEAVISVYKDEYLRRPNADDIKRLLAVGEERGFPGMIGSIDCTHWVWKNCPTAWHGQYIGKDGSPTIILEAVASYNLWIWHAFFGSPGSLNDLNVLDRSPVFNKVAQGKSPKANFVVNGHNYDYGYYLADGIYPKYAAFVKTIPCPITPKAKIFAQKQEEARKDVERAFGVLKARFAIVREAARLWKKPDFCNIMQTCIILHNMIIEDERDSGLSQVVDYDGVELLFERTEDVSAGFEQMRARLRGIMDRQAHNQLQEDLMEHMWARYGNQPANS
ncbi:hypothetical protein G6F52_007186 [Rhizopus delemar]|nr:hypothetical protein G6F52_007186 [Rhizopus delemar]